MEKVLHFQIFISSKQYTLDSISLHFLQKVFIFY